MLARRLQLASVLSLSLLLQSLPVQHAVAIYNGTSALGSESVVKLRTGKGNCSGVVIQPQIIVTAAHCIFSNGDVVPLESIRIYLPGVNVGENSSTVNTLGVFYPQSFSNDTSFTEPNDIAFIVIDRKFEKSKVLTLATYEITRKIVAAGVAIDIFGYGATSFGGFATNIPYKFRGKPAIQQRLKGFQGYERTYISYVHDYLGSTCPGDSGGPALADYNGVSYLVSVNSGGLSLCSGERNTTKWGGTGTIPGEYLELYEAALAMIEELRPSDVRDAEISSSALEGTISWSQPNESTVIVTEYLVTDGDGNEICRTGKTSCSVRLEIGVNKFYIFSVAGSVLSEGVELIYETQNASTPNFQSFSTYETEALVTWDPDIQFNNATPDSIEIIIQDSSDGSFLCSSLVVTGNCRFEYEARGYNLELILESDIAREEPVAIGRFSGITATSLVSRTKSNSLALNKRINGWLTSSPGYKLELENLNSEIPILDETYVFSDEKLQELIALSAQLTGLVARISSSPRKITVTCQKGKLTKKVTAVRPICPTGYRTK